MADFGSDNNFLQFSNSKIGILGFGYIGSNVYKYLSNLPGCSFEIIVIKQENLKLIETETFDYFINCAGNSGDFRSNILFTVESNICLHLYLLKHLKVRRTFLTLSSTRVYGFIDNKSVAFNEYSCYVSSHLNIDYIYDGSKMMIESILSNYAKNLDYNVKVVRLSNVYGKFNQLDDKTLIKTIIKNKINNTRFSTSVNKYSTKDYLYIDNAIEGIILTLLCPEKFEIYNIAFGESYSLNDVSEMLKLQIEFDDANTKELHSRIDITKSQTKLGFFPEINFQSGLNKIISNTEYNESNSTVY